MGFTNTEQLRELFLCAGIGFLLGIYYDVFRLLRLVLPSPPAVVFAQDTIFFVTSAVAIFLFSLVITDGVLRFYVFVGITAGFAAYRSTVGKLVIRQTARLLTVIRRFFRRIRQCARTFFTRLHSHIEITRKKPEKI